ncbi:MAG: hypothetical protein QXY70_00720 [Nanopusillaceae archaeon]
MRGALIDAIIIPVLIFTFIIISYFSFMFFQNFISEFNKIEGAYETTKNIQEKVLIAHNVLYYNLPLLYFGLLIASFISAYYSYTQPWMFIISVIFSIVAILFGWFLKETSLEFFKSLPGLREYIENNWFANYFFQYLPILIATTIFVMNILLFFKY